MYAAAELLIGAGWRVMPQRLRVAIATKIAVIQARCLPGVPRSILADIPATDALNVPLPSYSLLTTCFNEADTILEFLDSILRQTARPAEVVLADGGSSDATVDSIRMWEQRHTDCGFPLVVITGARLNIAEGRNRAAAHASHEVFLFADAGTTLDRNWAENLLRPFATDSECEVSMGWYKPILETKLQAAVAEYVMLRADAIDPEAFLPSARSLGVSRGAFVRAGGFPEYLSRAGEDTLFDYFLKSAARRWAFAPGAIAFWKMPAEPGALFRMMLSYAQGDAESPVMFGAYYVRLCSMMAAAALEIVAALLFAWIAAASGWLLFSVLAAACGVSFLVRSVGAILMYRPAPGSKVSFPLRFLTVAGMMIAQTIGFFRGLRNRSAVERRRLSLAKRGTIVLLTSRALGAFSGQVEHREVAELLKEGWDIVVVGAQGPPVQEEYSTLYAHANVTQYVRAAFDPQLWWQQMRRLDRESIAVTDRCHESWSKELTAALAGCGAQIRA